MPAEPLLYSKIFVELNREKSELTGDSKTKEPKESNEPLNYTFIFLKLNLICFDNQKQIWKLKMSLLLNGSLNTLHFFYSPSTSLSLFLKDKGNVPLLQLACHSLDDGEPLFNKQGVFCFWVEDSLSSFLLGRLPLTLSILRFWKLAQTGGEIPPPPPPPLNFASLYTNKTKSSTMRDSMCNFHTFWKNAPIQQIKAWSSHHLEIIQVSLFFYLCHTGNKWLPWQHRRKMRIVNVC